MNNTLFYEGKLGLATLIFPEALRLHNREYDITLHYNLTCIIIHNVPNKFKKFFITIKKNGYDIKTK